MPHIFGPPRIFKTVTVPETEVRALVPDVTGVGVGNHYMMVTVPEHDVEIFDEDAYWHLDYFGNEDPDGGFLYAKVAWPTLADAQRQYRNDALAREAERAADRERTKQLHRERKAQRDGR